MKKILIAMLFFSVFMVVSCDDGDTGDTGNTGDTGDMFNPEDCTDNFPHYHAGLCWSDKASNAMNLDDANSYCEGLGGRLPKIQELRTLIQNCPQTEYPQPEQEDWCEIEYPDKSSITYIATACNGCASDNTGKYSVFGDAGWFWSSSPTEEEFPHGFYVNFTTGAVNHSDDLDLGYVICVIMN
jgi:hypothetical protein